MRIAHATGRHLKGQMIFEFVIATLFFLAIVMYTINYINTEVSAQSGRHSVDTMENMAWQISESVLRNKGVWSGNSPFMVPKEIGLEKDWPVLDSKKIESLDNWCKGNMIDMMRLLDVDPDYHGTALEIRKYEDPGESTILQCGSVPQRAYSSVTRFAVSEDKRLLKVKVMYW